MKIEFPYNIGDFVGILIEDEEGEFRTAFCPIRRIEIIVLGQEHDEIRIKYFVEYAKLLVGKWEEEIICRRPEEK